MMAWCDSDGDEGLEDGGELGDVDDEDNDGKDEEEEDDEDGIGDEDAARNIAWTAADAVAAVGGDDSDDRWLTTLQLE